MKYPLIWVLFGTLFLLVFSGCKGEECGCDAETKFFVNDEVGFLFVDENENYAYISTESVLGRFELCNPENWVDQFRQYEDYQSGVRVIFSGDAKDDCIKLYYQYYYYYYKITLTDIEKID